MLQTYFVYALIVLFTIIPLAIAYKKYRLQVSVVLSSKTRFQLLTSGLIAFFMDTVGVGSFACGIALSKYFKTFDDKSLLPSMNVAQLLPGAFSAIFYLKFIHIDALTLSMLTLSACFGGGLGAMMISRMNVQAIRACMLILFPFIILLVLGHDFQWLPIGGDKTRLEGMSLWVGSGAVFIAGVLTPTGIGLFVLVQATLFCLQLSPLMAFPIMTTAGALQQPIMASIFLLKNPPPLQKVIYLSCAGVVGVWIAISTVTHLSVKSLHYLLVLVLLYNTLMIARDYLAAFRFNKLIDDTP